MSSVLEHNHGTSARSGGKDHGCQCKHTEPVPGCCDLICFERPNYFCGHLLSDQDLMREQTYFREKNRLYHRALHGQGIVCGLRLLCDSQPCDGYVGIETGYAIDDCGNDLVVCQPARYNVIKALRDKGWLFETLPHDPCKPKTEEEECSPHQCFYVVACYAEEPTDYITPFVPGCKTALKECEPTRVRETVRFDVWDKLPPETSPLRDYADRIGACFDVFSEGSFAQYLRDHQAELERILGGNANADDHDKCSKLFCEMRGFLLLYLKKHPERYNCLLVKQISDLKIEHKPNSDEDDCAGAICKLIEFAVRHAYTCAMNEIMPHCPPAKEPGCIVLGTVEVSNGVVMRVCNCPREYVWSFANFFEVLLATLMSGALCKDKDKNEKDQNHRGDDKNPCADSYRHVCCDDIDVSCQEILKLLSVNRKAMHYRGVAGLDAVMQMRDSLAAAVDFTRRGVYAPAMFAGMPFQDAMAKAKQFGLDTRAAEAPLEAAPPSPFEMMRRTALATERDPLVLVREEKGSVAASYAQVRLGGRRGAAEEGAGAMAEELQALRERIETLEARLKERPQPSGPNKPKGQK